MVEWIINREREIGIKHKIRSLLWIMIATGIY